MKTLKELAKRAKIQHRNIEPVTLVEFRDDIYRDCLVYQFKQRKQEHSREVQVALYAEEPTLSLDNYPPVNDFGKR